jgi:hypothetical protein
MESMIRRVTANIATGISARMTRTTELDTTIAGAASQTILNTGGMFPSARRRSRHFGRGKLRGFAGDAVIVLARPFSSNPSSGDCHYPRVLTNPRFAFC